MAVSALSACSSVQVNDEIAYGLKPAPLGAVSVHTLFPGQTDLTEADWLNLRASTPLICASVATFGEVKKEFEQLCSVCSNCCDYSTTAAVNAFFTRISTVKAK